MLRFSMPTPSRSFPELPPTFPPLPSWARPGRAGEASADPAFLAGAALAAIDPIAQSAHPLSTLWRRRLALKASENLAKLQGRPEGAADIRDHFFLTRDGGDPGPAGKTLGAMRALCDARATEIEHWSALLAAPLQLRLGDDVNELLNCARAVAAHERPSQVTAAAPLAAAATVARESLRLFPDDPVLALWLADAVLACRLRWRAPVPLLATQLTRKDLKEAALLRSDALWVEARILSYAQSAAAAAADLYADLARRAEKLLVIAPKLRAKDAPAVVQRLLTEDAQLAGPGAFASDRSSRRLFDRLIALGGARELTGRTTSRLYGL